MHKLLTVRCYHTRTKQLVTNRLTWCVSQQSLTMLCSHGAPILCTLHTALYVVQAIVTSQKRSCPEVSILIYVMCSKPLLLILGCLQILHRDIKSGNILLSQHFESAKICDVGLAHIMTNTSLSSSTSSSGGQQVQTTLAYAAPELLLCLRSNPPALFLQPPLLLPLLLLPLPRLLPLLQSIYLSFYLSVYLFFYYSSSNLVSYLLFHLFFYLCFYLFFFQFCAALLFIRVHILFSAPGDVTQSRADTKLACAHMLPRANSCFKGWLSDSAMQATALLQSPCQICLIAFMSAHLLYFGISTVLLLQEQEHSLVLHAQSVDLHDSVLAQL